MKKIRKKQKSNIKKRNSKKRFVKRTVQMFQKSFRRFLCKIHVVMICGILLMPILTGCGRDVSVLKSGTMEDSSKTEDAKYNDTENQDTRDEQGGKEVSVPEENNTDIENLIYVDVGGAVKNPGVYALREGSRVFEVIAQAGGFTKDAYVKAINQAQILEDGEQIYVYTMQEAEELFCQEGTAKESFGTANDSDGKVNLNLADKGALMTLTGIGETRAEAILQYRSEHGKFRNIEELMQVDGIKEKTYEKIKDCITVQ